MYEVVMGRYRFVLIQLVFLLLTFSSKAQLVLGLEDGVNLNKVKVQLRDQSSSSIKPQIGYNLGVVLRMPLKRNFSLELIPALIQKNYRVGRSDSLNGIYVTHTITYCQLPILLHYTFSFYKHLFAQMGPSIEYEVRSYESGLVPDIFSVTKSGNANSNTYTLVYYRQCHLLNNHDDNRLDFSWTEGIGLQYRMLRRYLLSTTFKYLYSFTNINQRGPLDLKSLQNRSFIITISCMYINKNRTFGNKTHN